MWRCKLIGHAWVATAQNKFQIIIEQKCKRCDMYRHHTFVDIANKPFGSKPDWHEGEHPG